MPALNSKPEEDSNLRERRNFLKIIEGGYSKKSQKKIKKAKPNFSFLFFSLQEINRKLTIFSVLSFLFSGFLYFVSSSLETKVLEKLGVIELQIENHEDLKSNLSRSYNLSIF